MRQFFPFGAFSVHISSDGQSPRMVRFERRAEILAQAVRQVRERLGQAASICVIGDTPSDIEAARELGLPIVAVATGTFSRAQLEPFSPDLCCECLEELLA
jgi:phosphoglycolate phosphatase-like HAD superfamily hydrolase